MLLNVGDIKNRMIKESSNYCTDKTDFNLRSIDLYNSKGGFILENAKYILRNWKCLSENADKSFMMALDVFDEICENCNPRVIRDCRGILLENVDKFRDANQLMNSIKYRNSRLKTKISTKINTKLDDINNKTTNSVNDIGDSIKSTISSLGAKSTASAPTGGAALPSGPATPANDQLKAAEESYNMLYDKAKEVYECDRIIRNYKNIHKRFNFDKMINEIYTESDMYDTIIEMCTCIDTYKLDFRTKYNSALESAAYGLGINHVNTSRSNIVDTVTDYFVMNYKLDESKIDDINYIKSNSVMFNESDFDCINYLITKPAPVQQKQVSENVIADKLASSYGVEKVTEGKLKEWSKGNPGETDEKLERAIDEFRAKCAKQTQVEPSEFKTLINKIFSKNPDQIVNELPSAFNLLRVFFVLGNTAIHPALGVVAFITSKAMTIHVERKQMDKIIKAYDSEIKKTKNKLNKLTSGDAKNRMNSYLEQLNKDREKLVDYENNIYSDKEDDEHDRYQYDDISDDDFDFDDFNVSSESVFANQAASIIYISELTNSIYKSLCDKTIEQVIKENLCYFDIETIDNITDFTLMRPIFKESLTESMKENLESLRKEAYRDNNIDKYIRASCISDNIYKLERANMVYSNDTTNIKSLICNLKWLDEMVKGCNCYNGNYLTEMNFSNTLKLATNKLKKNAINLSTKEKNLSNRIDVSMRSLSKSIEDAMIKDNRDAIIKGSILPSASACIKIAIATGAAWAVSPAVAVIGVLGGLACDKKMKDKQRQMVLDDIEIELKMCDRYMKRAEDKDDLEAVRQLEITQRSLQRQQQRIKYKMNVAYAKNVPGIKNSEDD